jgi:hypothetical protein
MSFSSDDLFAAAYAFVAGRSDFRRVYDIAVELVPELHLENPDGVAAQLASMVVASDAESSAGEFTARESRDRLAKYLATASDPLVLESDLPTAGSTDEVYLTSMTREVLSVLQAGGFEWSASKLPEVVNV